MHARQASKCGHDGPTLGATQREKEQKIEKTLLSAPLHRLLKHPRKKKDQREAGVAGESSKSEGNNNVRTRKGKRQWGGAS